MAEPIVAKRAGRSSPRSDVTRATVPSTCWRRREPGWLRGMSTSEWALQIHRRTVLPGRQRVDRDGERQDQRCVFAVGDLNAVGLAHAEPLLGDRRDRVTVTLDLVLVIDHVAVCLHVGAVFDVDRESVADPDERLVDGRGGVAITLDDDLVA